MQTSWPGAPILINFEHQLTKFVTWFLHSIFFTYLWVTWYSRMKNNSLFACNTNQIQYWTLDIAIIYNTSTDATLKCGISERYFLFYSIVLSHIWTNGTERQAKNSFSFCAAGPKAAASQKAWNQKSSFFSFVELEVLWLL